MGVPAALSAPALQRAVQPHARLTAGLVQDFAVAPGHRQAQAQANGLTKRLFGRKTGGQKAHPALRPPLTTPQPYGVLLRPQNACRKARAVALQRGGDTAHVAQIGADADDHAASWGTPP